MATGIVTGGAGSGTINLNGGTLKPLRSTATFIAASGPTLDVMAGGAVIDTNGFDIGIAKTLQADAVSIGGGLKKLGLGSLTLTADPGYTGNTTVDAGALTVGNLNTPRAVVYIATGTTLNATSIVADTLTIGGPPLASSTPVPEPGGLLLLALAGAAPSCGTSPQIVVNYHERGGGSRRRPAREIV